MFKYRQITDVLGRRILDGRGMPAIEVEVLSEDGEVGSVHWKCLKHIWRK